MPKPRVSGALLLAIALASCRVDVGRDTARSTTAVRQQGAVAGAPMDVAVRTRMQRPMADRREAQALLDSASGLLGHADRLRVIALLDRAATFFRVQAKSPPSGGTAELLATVDSLHAVAGRLARGSTVEPAALRALSARANLAEAERHGALASVAWSTQSKESVADELLMAADHVERAAADGGVEMPRSARRLLGEMRDLAATLPRRHGVDLQALEEPLADLHLQIAVMRRRVVSVSREGDDRATVRPVP